MTDDFTPQVDHQPVIDDQRLPEFTPDGEPAVYILPDEAEPAPPVEIAAPMIVESVSFRERLRRLFGGGYAAARLADLTQMIADYPDVAANYVLRGELLLEAGDYAAAADDLRRGLELAAARLDAADWGLVAQTLQDRALAGLEHSERRLRRDESSIVGAGL